MIFLAECSVPSSSSLIADRPDQQPSSQLHNYDNYNPTVSSKLNTQRLNFQKHVMEFECTGQLVREITFKRDSFRGNHPTSLPLGVNKCYDVDMFYLYISTYMTLAGIKFCLGGYLEQWDGQMSSASLGLWLF